MKSTAIATLLSFAAFCPAAQAAQSNPTGDTQLWFLAGREGGCAPLSVLVRKGTDLADTGARAN